MSLRHADDNVAVLWTTASSTARHGDDNIIVVVVGTSLFYSVIRRLPTPVT